MGSSAPPKRRFDFFADRATPRTFPSARVNSVTSRSASRIGYVRNTMASDSLSAIVVQLACQFSCDGVSVREISHCYSPGDFRYTFPIVKKGFPVFLVLLLSLTYAVASDVSFHRIKVPQ